MKKFIKAFCPHPNDRKAWDGMIEEHQAFEPMQSAHDGFGRPVGAALMDSFCLSHPEVVVGDTFDLPQDLLMGVLYGNRPQLPLTVNEDGIVESEEELSRRLRLEQIEMAL